MINFFIYIFIRIFPAKHIAKRLFQNVCSERIRFQSPLEHLLLRYTIKLQPNNIAPCGQVRTNY